MFFGEFKNVGLSHAELEKLKNRFTEKGAMYRIENLSRYVASNGKKYKSHYATILNWESKNSEVKPMEIPMCGTCKKKPISANGLCVECNDKRMGSQKKEVPY